jgi:hypothetical protein
MLNPLILLIAAGAAAMAFGRKGKNGKGPITGGTCASASPTYHEGKLSGLLVDDGHGGCILQCQSGYELSPDGMACVPVGEAAHVVDEGEITSDGGEVYAYRIWFIDGQVAGPYVGELLIDDVWTSGSMGPDAQEVAAGLEVFADSLDDAVPAGLQTNVACVGSVIEGPFDWYTYNEVSEQWEAQLPDVNMEPLMLDPAQVYEPGRGFCVIEHPEQPGSFIAQVYDANSQVMVEFVHPDPSVAASMAYYGIFNPSGPFPWVPVGG